MIASGPLSYSNDYLSSSLIQKWWPLVLSHTKLITSGPLSYSSDYLWSSLIQQWLPLVLSNSAVIAPGPLSYIIDYPLVLILSFSFDYPWSSLIQQFLLLILSHTVVTSRTHWWVTSVKGELLKVWRMTCGNMWSVVSCYCKNTEGWQQVTIYTYA